MPYYACPNCGSSVSSAAAPGPIACPGCCATMREEGTGPSRAAAPLRERAPAPAVRMSLGPGEAAPATARHALRELRDDLGDARFHLCELLVSELVTNVVRHAATARPLASADMRVRLYPDRVRVEVRDEGPGFSARPGRPDVEQRSGWGLQLIEEMADSWGVEPGVPNCVWFELGRTPLPSGSHGLAHA